MFRLNRLLNTLQGYSAEDSSSTPRSLHHVPTNPFDMPMSPAIDPTLSMSASANVSDDINHHHHSWQQTAGTSLLRHSSHQSNHSFEVVGNSDLESSRSSMSLMSFQDDEDMAALPRLDDNAHPPSSATSRSTSHAAHSLGGDAVSTVGSSLLPAHSDAPDSDAADRILHDHLLPTLALAHHETATPLTASYNPPTINAPIEMPPPPPPGPAPPAPSYLLGWLRSAEPHPSQRVTQDSLPDAPSSEGLPVEPPLPSAGDTHPSAATNPLHNATSLDNPLFTPDDSTTPAAWLGGEEGWEVDRAASPPAVAPPARPISVAAAIKRGFRGLVRAHSQPLLGASEVSGDDGRAQEVVELKEELGELADKLLSAGVALCEEQNRLRQAEAEACAQRALVQQLLASQMGMSRPSTPGIATACETPTAAAAATLRTLATDSAAGQTAATDVGDDDTPEGDDLWVGQMCGLECLFSTLLIALGRIVKKMVGWSSRATVRASAHVRQAFAAAGGWEGQAGFMLLVVLPMLLSCAALMFGHYVLNPTTSSVVSPPAAANHNFGMKWDPVAISALAHVNAAPNSDSPTAAATAASAAAVAHGAVDPTVPAVQPPGYGISDSHLSLTSELAVQPAVQSSDSPKPKVLRVSVVSGRRPRRAHAPSSSAPTGHKAVASPQPPAEERPAPPADSSPAGPVNSTAPPAPAASMESQLRLQHAMLMARETMLQSHLNVVRALLQDLEGAAQRAGLSLPDSSTRTPQPPAQASNPPVDTASSVHTDSAQAGMELPTTLVASQGKKPCPARPLPSLPCAMLPQPMALNPGSLVHPTVDSPLVATTAAALQNETSLGEANSSAIPTAMPAYSTVKPQRAGSIQLNLGWTPAALALPPRCETPSYQQYLALCQSARATSRLLSAIPHPPSTRHVPRSVLALKSSEPVLALGAPPAALALNPNALDSSSFATQLAGAVISMNGTQGLMALGGNAVRELAQSVGVAVHYTFSASQARLLALYMRGVQARNLTSGRCTSIPGREKWHRPIPTPAGHTTHSPDATRMAEPQEQVAALGWPVWSWDKRPCQLHALRRAIFRLQRLQAGCHRAITKSTICNRLSAGCGTNRTVGTPQQGEPTWWRKLTGGSNSTAPNAQSGSPTGLAALPLLNLWRALATPRVRAPANSTNQTAAVKQPQADVKRSSWLAAVAPAGGLAVIPARAARAAPASRRAPPRYYAPAGLRFWIMKAFHSNSTKSCNNTSVKHSDTAPLPAPQQPASPSSRSVATEAPSALQHSSTGYSTNTTAPSQLPSTTKEPHWLHTVPKALGGVDLLNAEVPPHSLGKDEQLSRTLSALYASFHVTYVAVARGFKVFPGLCVERLGKNSPVCKAMARWISNGDVPGSLYYQIGLLYEDREHVSEALRKAEEQQLKFQASAHHLKQAVHRALQQSSASSAASKKRTCTGAQCATLKQGVTAGMVHGLNTTCACSAHMQRAWRVVAVRLRKVHKHMLRWRAAASSAARQCERHMEHLEQAEEARVNLVNAMTVLSSEYSCVRPDAASASEPAYQGCSFILAMGEGEGYMPALIERLQEWKSNVTAALSMMDAWAASVDDAVPWVVQMRQSLAGKSRAKSSK